MANMVCMIIFQTNSFGIGIDSAQQYVLMSCRQCSATITRYDLIVANIMMIYNNATRWGIPEHFPYRFAMNGVQNIPS